MIVSHHHKFVFVAIPKTATHTVRHVLRPQLKPHDWEQCTLFEKRYFPIEAIAKIPHGHISCQQLRPYILPALWGQYTKFCIVRNPYSRFLSLCSFLSRNSTNRQRDPLGHMKRLIQEPSFQQRILARPQTEFICDTDGTLLVDHVGRYETLQTDLNDIVDALHLKKPRSLSKHNVSRHEFALEQFDDELIELIQSTYRSDFKLFGYPTQLAQGA